MIVYGGVDANDVGHTDLWQYDLETSSWEQIAADCQGESCPLAGERNFILASKGAARVAVYGGAHPNENRYYVYNDSTGEWTSDTDLNLTLEPVAVDCDLDGQVEEETTRACRFPGAWYSEVGHHKCAEPGVSDELSCDAESPEQAVQVAVWSPCGWEWIIDYEEGPDDYTYVLTDGTLYALDTSDTAVGLSPISSTQLWIPGNCPWCNAPDWGYDVEVYDNTLLIGSWGGVHVFSLEDPSMPAEIGFYWAVDVVSDLARFGPVVYIAEGPWVTALSLADPAQPTELNYVWMDQPVLALDVNEENRQLMALTAGSLRRMNIAVDPTGMTQTAAVGLAWNAFAWIKTEGRWTYLHGGNPTQTVYDNGPSGLQKRGPHNLRGWIDGIIQREDRAERVNWSLNELQIWGTP